jgi:serine protease inhibitor
VIESDPTPTTPFLLVFNRPYFFAIRDTLTGAIVMMGSIGNPAKMMSKA